jgi:HEAT repeat protein
MLDSKQIKTLGLRFARALQSAIKTASVFTLEHKSCERPIQQSFLLLNNLLKEVGQFTFGFVDNQVMLNNLLTTDSTLKNLETEFLKRGVAAITFEPGLTLSRFTKVIHVLSANMNQIEAVGGFLAFLDRNEVDGVRILPAAKNQKKNEHGDTIIETDSESYILSKQMPEEQAPRDFLDAIDSLLESGCFDPSTRTEVISNFASNGLDGSGYGVPIDVPNLTILKEGQAVGPAGGPVSAASTAGVGGGGTGGGGGFPGGGAGYSGREGNRENGDGGSGGGRALYAAVGQGGSSGYGVGEPAPGGGMGTGTPAPNQFASGAVAGAASPSAGADLGYSGNAAADPAAMSRFNLGAFRTKPGDPGSSSFLELVDASVTRSLMEEKGNPQKSYASLVRILRNTGVDKVLERFPAERRDELRSLSPEQLAAEYIEDTALQLAGEKLRSAGAGSQKLLIEEDVIHVLARSLQATHKADRLAQKLTKFIQDFAVPHSIQDKIKEELQWTAFNNAKKYARLMEIRNYSNIEFRRFLEFLKELVVQREMERATALASHYFDFLDEPNVKIESSELSRAPELIRSIPLAQVGFAAKTAERLGRALEREDLSEFVHFQAANTLTVLAQSIAAFENFQDVVSIGTALESSNNRDPERHKKCCATGLARLLPAAGIERVTELYLLQRGDSAWSKIAATLLRFTAPASIEAVFTRLIRDEDARNRLSLVRLLGQLGKGSIEVACRYLEDERWYVVRNMCGVLAEIKDPKLVEHIAPALRHPDARVQQATLKALVKSRDPEAATVLAAALPKLSPAPLDEALDELMYLRHEGAIADLEAFVSARTGNLACMKKAVQALGSIEGDAAVYALGRLFRLEELDNGVRRSALIAVGKHPSPIAMKMLAEFAANWGALSEEARNELERRKGRSPQ